MKHSILIAGAGGIGRAAGLLLREHGDFDCDIYIGDIYLDAAKEAANWILEGSNIKGEVIPFLMPAKGSNAELDEYCKKADILLDCLPGKEAPRMAQLSKDNGLHYANLTEHVKETNEIEAIAKDADTGFILQTGLAPGFINVLGNYLFQNFCKDFGVETADYIALRVGALTVHTRAPHFYGYTWSAVGVATEYLEDAVAIRDGKRTTVPSLSERRTLIIDGETYEEDLTSGGAADMPDVLAGKVARLDYKTLRYPGHYAWVDSLLKEIPAGPDRVNQLQAKMEAAIPHVEDDIVVIYASVQGKDSQGKLRLVEKAYKIAPILVGNKTLRAIQSTTASALVESARLLLNGGYKGPVFQSQINPADFMNGIFVGKIYR